MRKLELKEQFLKNQEKKISSGYEAYASQKERVSGVSKLK